jgi:hypothetical protein
MQDECIFKELFNPLNAELNPICHFLTLLGAHPILHISRIRVKVTQVSASVLKYTLSAYL